MFQLNFEAIRAGLSAPTDKIINGKKVAKLVRHQVRDAVTRLRGEGVQPKLAVVLVGENAASKIYVRHKVKACDETGIESVLVNLPVDISQTELHREIEKLSNDDSVDGILVQFPLPDHIDELDAVACIDPLKDVDGFTPHNLGRLMA